MARPLTNPGILLAIAATAAIGVAGCGGESDQAGDIDSRIGSDPKGVVLATAEASGGRTITLRAETIGGGGPCLTLEGVEEGLLRGCGRAPSERVPSGAGVPIRGEATARRADGAPLEVYGVAAAGATEVRLAYTMGGRREEAAATLLAASEPAALEQARIGEPFVYFFGEVPPEATAVQAVAIGRGGERLGSATFEEFGGLDPRAFILGAP